MEMVYVNTATIGLLDRDELIASLDHREYCAEEQSFL